jgi:hypothetical protein
MAEPNVPRLQNFLLAIPDGQILVLGTNQTRHFLALSHADETQNSATHVWVGEDPPNDLLNWMTMADTGAPMVFSDGVYGPVRIATSTVGDGTIMILVAAHDAGTNVLEPVLVNTTGNNTPGNS